MQFTGVIQQVAIHRRATLCTAATRHQCVGLGHVPFQNVKQLSFWDQVDGGLAALFRWQRVARAAQKNTCGRRADPHLTATCRAIDVRQHHWVSTHATFGFIFFGYFQARGEIFKEAIQNLTPFFFAVCHIIQFTFHMSSKIVAHQLGEVLFQTIGNNLTHLLGVETAVLNTHITTILDGRDNRCVR